MNPCLRSLPLIVAILVAALTALRMPARADAQVPRHAAEPAAPSTGPGLHASPVVPHAHRPPGAAHDDPGPSTVIFPVQRIPLRFDHRRHAGELGMDCTDCHARAATSAVVTDDLFPAPRVCDGCHDSDHQDLEAVTSSAGFDGCNFCHTGHAPEHETRVERVVTPTANLKFSHRAHAARNIGCQQCHGAVQEIGLATRDQLPRMRGCFRCHDLPEPARGEARGECSVCHLTEKGRLKTSFATGDLLPPAWLRNAGHGPDFLERHKAVAAASSQFCATCHAEQECVECHDGRVRPRRVHPNDWLSLHAISARKDAPRCSSCHRAQSFCVTCHQRAGITWSGPLANGLVRGRFHPPRAVWTDPPRSAGHHAWEAQRNMDACVSCHNERDCALCHATTAAGGLGGPPGGSRGLNPHPVGFATGCRAALKKNARPCLVCHVSDDPLLDRCR